jgi:hypothetical protein
MSITLQDRDMVETAQVNGQVRNTVAVEISHSDQLGQGVVAASMVGEYPWGQTRAQHAAD